MKWLQGWSRFGSKGGAVLAPLFSQSKELLFYQRIIENTSTVAKPFTQAHNNNCPGGSVMDASESPKMSPFKKLTVCHHDIKIYIPQAYINKGCTPV